VVLAQKIAEIEHSGDAEAILPGLSWSVLSNTCIILLRQSGGGDSDDSDSGADVVEEGDEDATESATTEAPDAGGRTPKQLQDIIRVFPFTRSFTSLDLSSFTILSSGSTTAFTVSVPVLNAVPSIAFPTSLYSVPYNKWSTLPYLQLTGWDVSISYYIAFAVFAAYYLWAYISSNPISGITSLAKRVSNVIGDNNLQSRMDALHVGVADLLDNALHKFGQNKNRRRNPNYDYYYY